MAATSVLEPAKQARHGAFARRFLQLVIPPKIVQPSTATRPNFCDTQNLAMYFYSELSEISEILADRLYLSGCSPVTADNLAALGVTGVVCALSEYEERRMMAADRQQQQLSHSTVKKCYVRLIDTDSSDIEGHFESAGRFIEDELAAGGRVLVHCAAGISRSSTLVLAYLMRYRGYDLRRAFDLVKSARKVVRPNNGFFQKLIDYERSIFRDDRAPTVRMVKQAQQQGDHDTTDAENTALIPDILLEHANKVSWNDWRHLA